MKKFVGFPSIEQYRNVVREVKLNTDYKGADENGKAIYANDSVYPTIRFTGTVKIHGTNAAVCSDGTETWAQSRNNIITPEHDNAGFATWAYRERAVLGDILERIRARVAASGDIVAMYGEWAGSNIQKGVAVTGLEKFFSVFAVRIISPDDKYSFVPEDKWNDLVVDASQYALGLYSVFEFDNFSIDIDFNSPELVQNTLSDLTIAVEDECPVGRYFGRVQGKDITVGEGIVWTAHRGDGHRYCFKVKGEKHSVSKVRTLAAVDVEKVNSVKECVDKVCTVNRMKQGFDYLAEQGLDRIPQNLGVYIKWLNGDIFKEELDTVVESGLTPKDVTKEISTVGRKFFLENM